MKQLNEIYKCAVCGNIVEVVHGSGGELVCCGQAMLLMSPNTVDAAKEKHLPVIDRKGDIIEVRVGSVPHPMEAKHYIEWIELITKNKVYRQYLQPGEEPKAIFLLPANGITAVRAYCNLHGLWETKVN